MVSQFTWRKVFLFHGIYLQKSLLVFTYVFDLLYFTQWLFPLPIIFFVFINHFSFYFIYFHFLFLEGGLLVILKVCLIFLSPFLDSFYPSTARLWKFLYIKCFSLTYDLNGFKSRINRQLFVLLFLVSPCLVVAVQPFMEWIPIRKRNHFEGKILMHRHVSLLPIFVTTVFQINMQRSMIKTRLG